MTSTSMSSSQSHFIAYLEWRGELEGVWGVGGEGECAGTLCWLVRGSKTVEFGESEGPR